MRKLRSAVCQAPRPRLRVTRGLRINVDFMIADGPNTIGRRDDDVPAIDLTDQEPVDGAWASRRHAVITLANGSLTLEDLQSRNGTFVNRRRVFPGESRALAVDDTVQIGKVQLRVIV